MARLSEICSQRCRWSGPLLSLALLLTAAPGFARDPLDLGTAQDSTVNLALLQGPGLADAAQDLYLEVYLNRVHTRHVMHVAMLENGHLFAWPGNLEDIGLRLDGVTMDQYVDLAELPGLIPRYDELNQRLYLDAEGTLLSRRRQALNERRPKMWPATVTPGMLLNYDLYGTIGDGPETLSATTGLRAFSRYGVLENTGLSHFGNDDSDRDPYVRLDTTWTWSWQDELLALSAGDFIGGSVSWSRPTRIGGLQLRRNFALHPQLITYPIPQFFGEAALPSSIELYVNGLRQYRGEVLPGPFQLDTVPNINGAGQAQVVITDVLGRSRSIDFAYYNTPRLLQQGLSDYSVELGSIRRRYGLASFDYDGTIVGSGSLRYGVTDALTIETHAEGGDGLFAGGVGAIAGLGRAGSVNGAYAHSDGDFDGTGGHGSQLALGYGWTGAGLSLNYQHARTFGDYRDLATSAGRAPPQRTERALIAYGMGLRGSLSLHYTRLDTIEEGRFRSIGANYSVTLFDLVTAYVGGSRELDGERNYTAFAGISAALGHRTNAGASVNHSHGSNQYSAHLVRQVPTDGGSGWNVSTQQGDALEAYRAEVGYRGDHAEVRAGASAVNSHRNAYATASGSLVLMERDVFAARRINDGFALVSTDGVADVPVMLENRPIGNTDARGHYLLTGLNAYQPNAVSIDAVHLPLQIQTEQTRMIAVPADRSGVTLDFGLRRTRSALLILHGNNDLPIPMGSHVYRRGAEASPDALPAIVGYDGQAYLEDLGPSNTIKVIRSDDDSCTLHFAYPVGVQGIPIIGPLHCGKDAP